MSKCNKCPLSKVQSETGVQIGALIWRNFWSRGGDPMRTFFLAFLSFLPTFIHMLHTRHGRNCFFVVLDKGISSLSTRTKTVDFEPLPYQDPVSTWKKGEMFTLSRLRDLDREWIRHRLRERPQKAPDSGLKLIHPRLRQILHHT